MLSEFKENGLPLGLLLGRKDLLNCQPFKASFADKLDGGSFKLPLWGSRVKREAKQLF